MQLTIVQSEINTAIERFVRSMIKLEDNVRIDIQLRATRGEEGATAIIDIVEATAEEPARDPAPVEPKPLAIEETVRKARKPRTTTPANEPAPSNERPPADTPSQLVAPAEEEEVPVPAGSVEPNEEEEVETPAASEAVEEENEERANEPVAETPRQSLFAGLSRPKNAE